MTIHDNVAMSVSYCCSDGHSEYGINPEWLRVNCNLNVDVGLIELLYF
jgi:hypothetical protein